MGSEDTTVKLPKALVDWEERLAQAEQRIRDLEQRFEERGYDTRPMFEVHEGAIRALTERLDRLEGSRQAAAVAEVSDFDLLEIEILRTLADPHVSHFASPISLLLNENITRVEYYLQRLLDGGYADRRVGPGLNFPYKITQKGREFLVRNHLLE